MLRSCSDIPRHVSLLPWEGMSVRVYDDAQTAFKVSELLRDEGVDPETRALIFARLVFVDPEAVGRRVRDYAGIVAAAAWEAAGIDLDGSHSKECSGGQVIDWDGDLDYIRASVFQAYGESWDEISRKVSFRELCALVGLLPDSTVMGQAVYYRTAKPPRQTKWNREQVRAFRERQRFWRIGREKAGASMNDAATDAFNAIARAARKAKRG